MNLLQARNLAGITREKAASQLGIAVKTLFNWESGFSKIPGSFLPAIRELYNLTAEQALSLVSQPEKGDVA